MNTALELINVLKEGFDLIYRRVFRTWWNFTITV